MNDRLCECGHPMSRHEGDVGMYAPFDFCLDCECEIHPPLCEHGKAPGVCCPSSGDARKETDRG